MPSTLQESRLVTGTMSSQQSSTVLSHISDSESLSRSSADSSRTTGTTTTDFLAAVASEPPREEDWKGYRGRATATPTLMPRSPEESDDLPPAESLAEAAEIPVLDGDGNELTFKNLYFGRRYRGQRRLILFIRHWYCRVRTLFSLSNSVCICFRGRYARTASVLNLLN